MRIDRFEFPGRHGQRLAGRIDAPDGEPVARRWPWRPGNSKRSMRMGSSITCG